MDINISPVTILMTVYFCITLLCLRWVVKVIQRNLSQTVEIIRHRLGKTEYQNIRERCRKFEALVSLLPLVFQAAPASQTAIQDRLATAMRRNARIGQTSNRRAVICESRCG
jgi:hypothetical protein